MLSVLLRLIDGPRSTTARLWASKTPVVKPGCVLDFTIKVWGIYPALIICETLAYQWCACYVELNNGIRCVIVELSAGLEIWEVKSLRMGIVICYVSKGISRLVFSVTGSLKSSLEP